MKAAVCTLQISVMTVGSDTFGDPIFQKGLQILPDYECPGLICLALPARQKFGLILVIKFFLVEVIKNHLNKKCAPNLLFFNEKKNSERFG